MSPGRPANRSVHKGDSQRQKDESLPERMIARVLRERQEAMFSDVWFWLAGLFILLGLLLKGEGLIALAACLLTVLPVAWLWNHWSLQGLEYRRYLDRQRVFPGETVEITLEVINRKPLPLSWLRFQDEFPLSVAPVDAPLSPSASSETTGYLRTAFSIRWYERVRRSFSLHCRQRGYYYLGPVKAESGDLFTLFTSEEERLVMDVLIVYPQIWPLKDLGISARAPFGEIRTQHSLIQDPTRTQGIRDYRPEDGFRHVHWKASARRGELQTRLYEPTTDMNLVVVLDVATMPKIWMGVRQDLLEQAVVVAASIANYATEQKWTMGLLSNGLPRSDQPIKVPPGRSPDQLARVLEALAAVTSFSTSSVAALLRAESPRIPLGATLVVVSAIVTDELLVTLLQLKEAGRRVVLVSLDENPPPDDLGGIIAHHLLQDSSLVYRPDDALSEDDGTLAAIPIPKPVARRLKDAL